MKEDIINPFPLDQDDPASHATGAGARPPGLIVELQRMGVDLDRRWRRCNRDEHAFPQLAAEALSRYATDRLDLNEFIAWALTAEHLPGQVDVDSNFGEPPFTAFIGDGFQINLLFWLDGTTSIHRHMFSGAFRVVMGSSLQSDYVFRPSRRINSRLQLGTLEFLRTELLEHGTVQPILAGDQMIHSVFHLDRPSLTLVVRTKMEDDARPQMTYLQPGIAIDSSRRPRELQKRLQLLRMMKRLGDPAFIDSVLLLLEHADLDTTVRLLMEPDIGSSPAVRQWLAANGTRHGDAVNWMLPAYDRARRLDALMRWRHLVDQVDLRFFLGLLLNVPSHSEILKLVRQRYRRSPTEVIAPWIRELLALQRESPTLPPVIDLRLDEPAMALVRQLEEDTKSGGPTVSAPLPAPAT